MTFGNPAKLHLPQFTVETWFARQGAGTGTTTGTGGIALAIPLVARGRGEQEAANVDMNYFFGIDSATNTLAADFEEGTGGSSPSLNHPVFGSTAIPSDGAWHHAAATYDGTTWRLYLDGQLDGQATVGQPPASQGDQHASIGSALTSTGVAAGFFDGVIDEVRIWNRALPVGEIDANLNLELTSGNGLVARWGLNDATGNTATDSVASLVNGSITGAFTWVAGAPLNITIDQPPDRTHSERAGRRRQRRCRAADPRRRRVRPRWRQPHGHLLRPAGGEHLGA